MIEFRSDFAFPDGKSAEFGRKSLSRRPKSLTLEGKSGIREGLTLEGNSEIRDQYV